MEQSNISRGRQIRVSVTAATESATRAAGRVLRSLAVTVSLSFVFTVAAFLTVVGGAEAAVTHRVKTVAQTASTTGHHPRHRHHPVRLRSSGSVSPQEAVVVSGAAPCPNVNLVPTAANIPAVDQATLCLVNQQRRTHGVAPLTEDTRLDRAAQAHANDMIARGYFEHVSPSGGGPLQRMLSAGFLTSADGYDIGENIAWGTLNLASPANIVSDWMHSPGHRANILYRGFRKTGMGVTAAVPGKAAGGQAGGTYTQDFGTVLG